MSAENGYTVYKHTSPNGKVYIGITKQEPKKRFANGAGYKECPRFWNAINKYGWARFTHEILAEGLSKAEAESEEIRLIKQYRSNESLFGYNIENGGNVCGTHSDATRRKISIGNKGKKRSPEAVERSREAHKGIWNRHPNPFIGHHHADEFKRRKSEQMKGNKYFKGHHYTDEYKRQKSVEMAKRYSDGGNPRCKKVECESNDGGTVVFYSLREAARRWGVSPSDVYRWIKSGKSVNGTVWRYCE